LHEPRELNLKPSPTTLTAHIVDALRGDQAQFLFANLDSISHFAGAPLRKRDMQPRRAIRRVFRLDDLQSYSPTLRNMIAVLLSPFHSEQASADSSASLLSAATIPSVLLRGIPRDNVPRCTSYSFRKPQCMPSSWHGGSRIIDLACGSVKAPGRRLPKLPQSYAALALCRWASIVQPGRLHLPCVALARVDAAPEDIGGRLPIAFAADTRPIHADTFGRIAAAAADCSYALRESKWSTTRSTGVRLSFRV
jgi:hypothetical protein